MAEETDLSRTEPASPRRLQQVRSAGDVPRSAELTAWVMLLTARGVPAVTDANAVSKALLYHKGSDSPAVVALKADEQHFTYEQELERSSQGFYDGGGAT